MRYKGYEPLEPRNKPFKARHGYCGQLLFIRLQRSFNRFVRVDVAYNGDVKKGSGFFFLVRGLLMIEKRIAVFLAPFFPALRKLKSAFVVWQTNNKNDFFMRFCRSL